MKIKYGHQLTVQMKHIDEETWLSNKAASSNAMSIEGLESESVLWNYVIYIWKHRSENQFLRSSKVHCNGILLYSLTVMLTLDQKL
jgi:hypothetical protein